MGGHRPQVKPLHRNVIFIILIVVTCVFTAFSMVLYSQLENIEDDDLVLGGGGDGLRERPPSRRRLKQGNKRSNDKTDKTTSKKNDKRKPDNVAELFVDDEPETAIAKFQKDQEETKRRRLKQGLSTPREKFDQERFDPDDWDRIRQSVQALRQPLPPTQSQDLPYDVHNCPMDPPPNYPYAWNVMNVLENWNPDDTQIPSTIYQGICSMDWNDDETEEKAQNYRRKEVPFLLMNHPEVLKAAERWSTPGYLQELIGDERNLNEHSRNSHFMYWKTSSPRSDFQPPTDTVEMTYAQWWEKAQIVDQSHRPEKEEHWYYRLNAMLHNHAYLYEELPFFNPALGKSLTVVSPDEHRGINCRFGMKGTIAESHYDSHNNFIAMMGGQRRYILAHPDQCENMELYPIGHPSARHSHLDWSKAYHHWRDSERPFVHTLVNEVVLQPGDILYLPTHWFHFIVSLNTTHQCNSRSGVSYDYQVFIDKCGFGKNSYQNGHIQKDL